MPLLCPSRTVCQNRTGTSVPAFRPACGVAPCMYDGSGLLKRSSVNVLICSPIGVSPYPSLNCKLHRIFDSHLLEGNVTQLFRAASYFHLSPSRSSHPNEPFRSNHLPTAIPLPFISHHSEETLENCPVPKPSPKHRRHSPQNSPAPSWCSSAVLPPDSPPLNSPTFLLQTHVHL